MIVIQGMNADYQVATTQFELFLSYNQVLLATAQFS